MKEELDYETRTKRGLRALSLKVKEIVCEKKSSTYKEVAETLIQVLNAEERMLISENTKEE